ncbi:tail tube protein [Vibrio phage vB_VmeM-32]|nr:tail tube protein [Vibrio phage vB_VmeM-32]
MEVTDITRAFQSGDFARSNLFEVEIPLLGSDFKFKCKAAALPGAAVEAIPVSYQNKKIKIAGDRTFEDWNISVYNDDEHDTRQSFLDWQALAQSQNREISGETPETYKKLGIIRQLNRKGVVTKTYTINGIWPTNVQEVQLDWDTNNEVQVFEVTLSVDWWE